MSKAVDAFLKAGFSKEETSKIIDFWMKMKVTPFSKTEISKRIADIFEFFDEFSVSRNVAKKAIVKEPRLILTTTLPQLRKNLFQNAKLLNVEPQTLASILSRQPNLLTRSPDGLFSNLVKNAEILGVEVVDFLNKSLKQPTLLALSPELVRKNATLFKKILSIDDGAFSKLFKSFPNIMTRNPESVLELIDTVSQNFGVSQEDVKKSFLKAPSLFNFSAKNLVEKLNTGVDYFDMPKEDVCKMYLFAPTLFQMDPNTIKENVSKVASVFETDLKTIISSFLKMPSLFMCSPESIEQKYEFYKQMYLDDVFCLGNETKKDLNMLKTYLLKNAKETLINSMSSLKLRRICGIWLKENQGASSKAPLWKKPAKIMDSLQNVPEDFWKRNPVLFQTFLENQKGK